MGLSVGIVVRFSQSYMPQRILEVLLSGDWCLIFENNVTYLVPTDKNDYDWLSLPKDNFSLSKFVNSHVVNDKIGIVLVADNVGGEFLIFPDYLSVSLTVNRMYLEQQVRIVDYSWYLNRLKILYEEICVSDIVCSQVF